MLTDYSIDRWSIDLVGSRSTVDRPFRKSIDHRSTDSEVDRLSIDSFVHRLKRIALLTNKKLFSTIFIYVDRSITYRSTIDRKWSIDVIFCRWSIENSPLSIDGSRPNRRRLLNRHFLGRLKFECSATLK